MNKVARITGHYWRWLCETSASLDQQGHCGSSADGKRMYGELFTAFIDRFTEIGISTTEVLQNCADLSSLFEKYCDQLDPIMPEIMGHAHFAEDDVGKFTLIAAVEHEINHVQQYVKYIQQWEEGKLEDYEGLRSHSFYLFAGVSRIFQYMGSLDLDVGELAMQMDKLQQAIWKLASDFREYILDCYTDYYADFLPVTPYHLGQMLQCAAILDRIWQEWPIPSGYNANELNFSASSYKNLLDWFNEGISIEQDLTAGPGEDSTDGTIVRPSDELGELPF